ncbi:MULTISPECIES: alpha/beta hydrolase [unclassified Lentimonas]|uniref:alpha/beta hydrolase n=1 Tax=unclassified Lentimonas TaxID=2630993 RepID=UPI0013218690|nr:MULTISPECIES: alpha/beta hydrolase [unclassified Lentimonas]CAA6679266.1 Unannotated [Lentimonas sp. CC4]CAA6686300.1 Unannotated [Lentimonas sp. CC6]CAA7076076.1 Unannotated [Lentimonas sp. CC4]CAA7170931.1 Unannotated [Lentimonas sp. CC21]CAA7181126.1 Unannotated [Lentimonas sp. CC8]
MEYADSHNLPESIPVWPTNQTPYASSEDDVLPRLTYYLPSDEYRTGQSMLILPGGGYGMVSTTKEGHRPAQFLAAHGIAAAVLEYRHSPQRHPVPLLDAQRALRILRQRASETDGLEPNRVGCIGFSAGGHLCGTVATQPTHADGLLEDALKAIDTRPDCFAMIYPVVCLTHNCAHRGSRDNLLGPGHSEADAEAFSIENNINTGTPPCFIAHGQNDPSVPVENAIRLYQALTSAKVEATMHLYENTGHGIGLAANHPWGKALLDWLKLRNRAQ